MACAGSAPLSLEAVQLLDVDRVEVPEQRDQDCQPDRRLGGGDSQDEEHEHLARGIVQEGPGFFVGILAGAIVLTWLYNSSHGSVLAVVLWHASFNYVSASPNAGGFSAAFTSTFVILWAVAILWRYRGATLSSASKHTRPTGVLAV